METILTIIAVWFVASVPAALLIGRILAASNHMQDELVSEILIAQEAQQPVAGRSSLSIARGAAIPQSVR